MEGQNIKGLMEAYSKVYGTDEVLNEEIQSIEEQGRGRVTGSNPNVYKANERSAGTRRGAASGVRRGQGGRPLGDTTQRASVTPKPTTSGVRRGQGGRPLGDTTQRGGATPKPTTPKPATPATKPAARPAAKPAASPAAKPTAAPSATKPAPGTKAAGPESIKPKTPNPLMKDMPGATLKKAQEAPKPQMSARAQALKAGGPKGGARERMLNQGVDIFDLIKGHLLDEGYAETEENAIVMMANMSEEWRKSILEAHGVEILDEAQAARENPEKHEEDEEKENEKKYGKVRGEKTPMPPRGDKRREDFEKWYAKQMGR